MQAPFADPLTKLRRLSTPLPLVGRTFELQVFRSLLETVALDLPPGARALTISGEMGVGKSRLLAALCLEASEQRFLVLEASAYETGRTIPYLPFIEALRPLLHSTPREQLLQYLQPGLGKDMRLQNAVSTDTTDTSESIPYPDGSIEPVPRGSLVAALARLFPDLPARLQYEQQALYAQTELLSPDLRKFRLLDAIATLLERAAEQQPILLAIDNVQWADSASLELMFYLTTRLQSSRVALVGVTRPQYAFVGERDGEELVISAAAAAAVARVLGDLVRQGMLLLLPLSPLSEEEACQHLHALLPGTIPQSVELTLLARAEGNPFFLEELVRTLTLSQQLRLHNGVWQASRISNTRLPDGIVLAVEQRLHSLSEACRHLLRTAALFGRTFPLDALAQVAESDIDDLIPLLHEAVGAAIIADDASEQNDELEADGDDMTWSFSSSDGISSPPVQRYMFCQGIVQEVLLASVPAHRVRQLHSAIGRALEKSYAGDATRHAAELARHYARGGDKEAALRWSLRAGEDAIHQQAHREAISHFRLALQLLESGGRGIDERQPSWPELSMTIGELWFMLGELDQAAHAFQQALLWLRQSSDASPWLLSRVNRLLADAYRMQARYDQALAHLQAASAALDEQSESEGARHGFAERASGGGAAVAPAIDERASTVYGRGDGSASPANSTANDGCSSPAALAGKQIEFIRWNPGSYYSVGSIELQPELLQTGERIHRLQSQATLHVLLNRPQEAETLLWQSYHLAISIGDRGSQAFALHWVGYLRGWGEQIHEAIRLQEQAHELYLAIGDPYRAMLGELGLGMIYQGLGEMERASRYSQLGMEHAHRYGIRRPLGWLHWNQGMMAYTRGEWENSATQLQEALQEAAVNNDARLKPVVLLTQAELAFRRGDWREAEQLFLDSIQAATAMEWFPSTIALYGHFLAVTGRRVAARTQLDRAAAVTEPPGIAGNFYLPFLAEGYIHLDLPDHAATYIERIRNLHGFMYYGHAVDRILGVIASHMGDWDGAERAFEEALILCRRAGNQPEEATILYEQARMAMMRGDAVQRVLALCSEAREIFQGCGMERAVAMVDALRDGAEQLKTSHIVAVEKAAVSSTAATQTSHTTISDGASLEQRLTKRELEVLRLVAEGHTDREVADILIISPRTANRHLSNIFLKLDVPGRAAAVAYAVRQGLV